jgi:hypothetical protein
MSSSFQSGWIPNDSLQGSIESSLSSYKKSKKAPTGKITSDDYLKGFSTALMEGLNSRNRNAAQESMVGGVKFGESKGVGGSSSKGGMTDDLTIVHHPGAGYGPMFIPGQQGRSGLGGALAGAASGFMQGAATGMPHMAGIGAVAGGLGGLFG